MINDIMHDLATVVPFVKMQASYSELADFRLHCYLFAHVFCQGNLVIALIELNIS